MRTECKHFESRSVSQRRHRPEVQPRPGTRRALAVPRALPPLRAPAGRRGLDLRLAHRAAHPAGAARHRRRLGGGVARRGRGDPQLGRRPDPRRGRRRTVVRPTPRPQAPVQTQRLRRHSGSGRSQAAPGRLASSPSPLRFDARPPGQVHAVTLVGICTVSVVEFLVDACSRPTVAHCRAAHHRR